MHCDHAEAVLDSRQGSGHEHYATRELSINATTSTSSKSTTRALILCLVILPALAQRKSVRGQMPRLFEIVRALLKRRPAKVDRSSTLLIARRACMVLTGEVRRA